LAFGLAVVCLLAAAAVRWDLLPWLRGPAPYPPEWQWGYRPHGPARPLFAAALAAAGLLGLLQASGSPWARARPRRAAGALLFAATLGGTLLQLALLEREPQGALRALMARAVSPSISSYHTVAVADEARAPIDFLRAHAKLLPQLAPESKHAATHPPGPVLWYRGALALCEGSRWLSDLLLGAAGAPRSPSQTEQGRAIRAAALLGALGLTFCGMLTLWPLALLAEALGLGPLPAARVGLLWPLLPASALFTPALDAALALPIVCCCWLVARGSSGTSWWRALASGLLAGACGAVAFFGSYGAAIFLALGAAAVVAATGGDRARFARGTAVAAFAASATAALALGLPALLGHEPLLALRTALGLHRALFTAPRSYPLWLVFNPLDFAMFLGLPLALSGLWALRGTLRGVCARAPLAPLDRLRLALAGGLAMLLLLGATRGEVGRLWTPLMPFVLLAALPEDAPGPGAASVRRILGLGALLVLLTFTIGSYWVI
jgi:hypothetical protein